MLRWHSHLQKADIETRVLCFQKGLDDPEILGPSQRPIRTAAIKSRATQERWIDDCRTSFSDNFFSQPFFANPLLREEPVDWADVLHIHWISRALNVSHLADLAAIGKPLVLTPHDLWSVTGGCHYPAGCQQFRESCRACPMVKEESRRLVEISHRFKRALFSQSLRALVCPSTWIQNEIARCPGFETIKSFVVPYVWESSEFWPQNKTVARSALGVPSGRLWLLFLADNVNETRKGVRHFLQLVRNAEQRMREAGNENSFGVLIAGRGEGIFEDDIGLPVIRLGFLSDAERLRNAYSSADLFVYTGLEDNLPNVVTEALACGTPVLGYATGGVSDQVRSGDNGILVGTGDVEEITNELVELLGNSDRIDELAACARKSIEQKFDPQRIVKDLVSVYERVIADETAKAPLPLDCERAEYETFAVHALADLLESAEKRSSELIGEVKWLREEIERINAERGSLRELSELFFREIDAIFAVAPAQVIAQYEQHLGESHKREGENQGWTIAEKWAHASTKTFLLKEYFGSPSKVGSAT
jgi:glycosyltransferase involved in cell wall biosynthesis